ncbi:Hypothetical protein GLP15_2237 [Giardia lamblia P15]|uniref:Uncharacterized protein n=1 Tax=Giardia intestinalis (strain P15) TaxID=658858 RepID=E1F751_GIAIA|nr:Hypothetical protein GLP15_2237 [Giardia lamblia P15]
MRTVNLPSFTLPSQSYAIISYPTQQPHSVQDMVTQLRSSNTAINDQPQEIDPASQLTQMKVCDSVVSLPISNTAESGIPLYNLGSSQPSSQVPPASVANRVPVVHQQPGVNIGVMDANGMCYLITTPSSTQPVGIATQPNLQLSTSTAASNSSMLHSVSTSDRPEVVLTDSLAATNSTNVLNNTVLAQSIAQIAALLNTCHVSIIPTQSLPTATPLTVPTQSPSLSTPSTFPGRNTADIIRGVQPYLDSIALPASRSGDPTPLTFDSILPCSMTTRGGGLFDYPVTPDSMFQKHKHNSVRHKTIAERTYSNATVLWTPEKHEAFVTVYESLVNAKEKITQGAIFKEMKRRYPNFQLTLRQIQSKLQKYRLRLNTQDDAR